MNNPTYTHTPVVDLEAAVEWIRKLRVAAEYMDSSGMAERVLNYRYVEDLISEVRALRSELTLKMEDIPPVGAVTLCAEEADVPSAQRLGDHLKGWDISAQVKVGGLVPLTPDRGVVVYASKSRRSRGVEILTGAIARVLDRYDVKVIETMLVSSEDLVVYIYPKED